MTLDEHIEMLQDLRDRIGHGNFKVMYQFGSGDYWRTEVSQEVTDVDLGYVVPLAYHGPDKPVVLDESQFCDKRREHIEETGEQPETDEEGNTGIMMDGSKEIMQVVLLTAH